MNEARKNNVVALFPEPFEDDEDGDEGEGGSGFTTDDDYTKLLQSVRNGELRFGQVPETLRQAINNQIAREGADLGKKSKYETHPNLKSKPQFDGVPPKMAQSPAASPYANDQLPAPTNTPAPANTHRSTPTMRPPGL